MYGSACKFHLPKAMGACSNIPCWHLSEIQPSRLAALEWQGNGVTGGSLARMRHEPFCY
jgi:hypothetical protein